MSIDREILFRLATSSRFERIVRSVPRGREMAWRAASRYVAGTSFGDAVRQVRDLHTHGVAGSIDQFGELVSHPPVAERVADDYVSLATELAHLPQHTWLAIDLSHLGLDVDPARCAEHLAAIARALPEGRRIQVGAEDHARADAVLSCVLTVAGKGLADRLGATAQANLHRTPGDIRRLQAAGVHIRLVKGAYVEARDRALPYGEPTDLAFLRLAHQLAESSTPFALATHDGVLREALLAAHGPLPVEQLLGVRPDMVTDLVARDVPVRVYVPFGGNWFRYWMRRVAESRGA
ncbi:proline dehydrogenase [Saccharomonospora amisosensis]|uniref:Proline dehydrogenase n=1 Tax=Saccharomonospora amisosensis TaxID=1128677 RepID=A0A7X5ZT47_9PSEU|nr:proline dehydrogenase family protein [Saccharomonospora amisosensis]NIJ14634.1 proline dehydrogenase [Saccharomonospora amisosensis]